MMSCERVRDASEFESVWFVEGSCVEGYNAVPAGLYWNWVACEECVSGGFGPEVRECGCNGFVAVAVA